MESMTSLHSEHNRQTESSIRKEWRENEDTIHLLYQGVPGHFSILVTYGVFFMNFLPIMLQPLIVEFIHYKHQPAQIQS